MGNVTWGERLPCTGTVAWSGRPVASQGGTASVLPTPRSRSGALSSCAPPSGSPVPWDPAQPPELAARGGGGQGGWRGRTQGTQPPRSPPPASGGGSARGCRERARFRCRFRLCFGDDGKFLGRQSPAPALPPHSPTVSPPSGLPACHGQGVGHSMATAPSPRPRTMLHPLHWTRAQVPAPPARGRIRGLAELNPLWRPSGAGRGLGEWPRRGLQALGEMGSGAQRAVPHGRPTPGWGASPGPPAGPLAPTVGTAAVPEGAVLRALPNRWLQQGTPVGLEGPQQAGLGQEEAPSTLNGSPQPRTPVVMLAAARGNAASLQPWRRGLDPAMPSGSLHAEPT